ncbi:20779_t:CDS:2 [Gigaspora rosea]|nr:20779_t:CDS:2 [Gigaspora rosea]
MCPNHENQIDQIWSAFQNALDSNIRENNRKEEYYLLSQINSIMIQSKKLSVRSL